MACPNCEGIDTPTCMVCGRPPGSTRPTLPDFALLIRREGGMWNLFGNVGITPGQAPPELAVLVEATNRAADYLGFLFGEVAKVCGYREDDV